MDNRVLSDLQIDVDSPQDPSDYTRPFKAVVTCSHGASKMVWTRVCVNGCHKDVFKRSDCQTVNPTEERVRHAAVVQHAKRFGCSCCSIYWTEFGPSHDASQATDPEAHAHCQHTPFYVNEGPVLGEHRQQLLDSMRIDARNKALDRKRPPRR